MVNGAGSTGMVTPSNSIASRLLLARGSSGTTILRVIRELNCSLSRRSGAGICRRFLHITRGHGIATGRLSTVITAITLRIRPACGLMGFIMGDNGVVATSTRVALSMGNSGGRNVDANSNPVSTTFRTVRRVANYHCRLSSFRVRSIARNGNTVNGTIIGLHINKGLCSNGNVSASVVTTTVGTCVGTMGGVICRRTWNFVGLSFSAGN